MVSDIDEHRLGDVSEHDADENIWTEEGGRSNRRLEKIHTEELE
jgi:hypothetical protein